MGPNKNKASASTAQDKKPFNKVEWRKKRYNHKSKLQHFEEKRRKSALHKYFKELKKSEQGSSKSKYDPDASGPNLSGLNRFANPYEKAKQELERRSREKEELRAEKERQKAEREEALRKYKRDKIQKFVKLRQKTKKGQPVMAGRMELLLEKIQKSMGK